MSKESNKNKSNDNTKFNRNARLIIRNISFKATEDLLKKHFLPYGTVEEVKLLKRPDGRLIGCGFVNYTQVPMAQKAIAATNQKIFLERPISVDWAVAKNKYMSYIDQKKLEMQDHIKKEVVSDDEDDEKPFNISSEDLKQEVKDESDSDNEKVKSEDDSDDVKSEPDDDDVKSEPDDDDVKSESDDDDDVKSESDDDDEVKSEDDEDEEDEKDIDEDNEDPMEPPQERKRVKLNDAEDGCTVFITNIPFSVDKDQLKHFVEKFSPVKYALICIDQLTEHSRGSGFVKFTNSEDTERFLALPQSELKLEGQILKVQPALSRDTITNSKNKKQPKDNRNLYLVKEGVIVAGTKAAIGVSASDMAKRLTLEKSKTQMLKNLNRFVSRYRLVVSNLPAHVDDTLLRGICRQAVGSKVTITEARVMRHLRENVMADGKHPSKGYGFVMFLKHEDALACLRKLNNNPDIFDKNNRPIVSFSIEDRTALNARKKRLEKSIANNPTNKNYSGDNKNYSGDNKNYSGDNKNYSGDNKEWKNKRQMPDESKFNKGKKFPQKEFQNKSKGKIIKARKDDMDEYTGLTAREGTQHNMRSNRKLKLQANVHKQNVKLEKKKSLRTQKLKLAAKERIKQPKQKVNKDKKLRNKVVKHISNNKESFNDLVNKYKTKLVGNNNLVKAKWYDQ